MELQEFEIGKPFWTGGGKWICSDVGTRTVLGVRYDEMIDKHGKVSEDPVLCVERVFHRYDWGGCWKTEDEYNEIISQYKTS